MKKTRKNRIFYLVLLCALCAKMQYHGSIQAFANQTSTTQSTAAKTFQNNLLKVDLQKNSLGAVKLTLFTNKPYNDSTVVNKKTDFEYVVLMPETSNSLTVKPSIASVSDVVRSVDVKTQQYGNQLKGYTKITILTSKPIEIVTEAQSLNTSNQLNESDYNELLAQASKKAGAQPKKEVSKSVVASKTAVKTMPKAVKSATQSATPTSKVVATSAPSFASAQASAKKAIKKVLPPQNESKVITKNTLREKTITPVEKSVQSVKNVTAQKTATVKPVLPRVKQAEKTPVRSKVTQTAPITEKTIEPKPIVATSTGIKTPEVINEEPQDQSIPKVDTNQAQTNMEPTTANDNAAVSVPTVPTAPVVAQSSLTSRIKIKLKKYIKIAENNLYTLLGVALSTFILLLLIVRRNTQNHKKQKEIFKGHLNDKPIKATDYTENINEDMDWKEKFQTYVDTSNQAREDQQLEEPSTGQFGEGTDETIFSENTVHIEFTEDELFEQIQQQEKGQEHFDLNELFTEDTLDENIQAEFAQNIFVPNEVFEEETSSDEYTFLNEVEESNAEVDLEELFKDEESTETGNIVLNQVEEEESDEFEVEDEVVKSEFAIDSKKGFYLVDYEDGTTLVGHIEDEFFVLKHFNEKIRGPIQARLDEKTDNKSSYMTKVGSFRGLVEVTAEKMNLLIEL